MKDYGLMFCVCIYYFLVWGDDFVLMFIVFILVIRYVLECIGLCVDDVDLFEVNEVFVLVVFVWMCEIGVLYEKVNVNGGGIVFGYLIGVMGMCILVMMFNELECIGGCYGL